MTHPTTLLLAVFVALYAVRTAVDVWRAVVAYRYAHPDLDKAAARRPWKL